MLRAYLPSAQFVLIVASVAASGGLVIAAEKITNRQSEPSSSSVVATAQTNTDWLKVLREIQAQNSSYTLPEPLSESAVQTMLEAARSNNLTDTIGRTLLVNLSSAKAEGLGGDIPTQDKLVAQAAAEIKRGRSTPLYSAADLTVVQNTKETQRAYGNALIATLESHPKANHYEALRIVGEGVDSNNSTRLAALAEVGAAYTALTRDLLRLGVPGPFAPFHLQIVNDFAQVEKLMADIQTLLTDPLRGLAALELYESLMQEVGRLFTNIAQQFSTNGILFGKDEPGSAWSLLLP